MKVVLLSPFIAALLARQLRHSLASTAKVAALISGPPTSTRSPMVRLCVPTMVKTGLPHSGNFLTVRNQYKGRRDNEQTASFKISFAAATGATFASFAPAQSNDDENQTNLDVVSLVKIPRQ